MHGQPAVDEDLLHPGEVVEILVGRALLAVIRLEEFDYPAAAVLATVMLIAAFVMLLITNAVQARLLRYTVKS